MRSLVVPIRHPRSLIGAICITFIRRIYRQCVHARVCRDIRAYLSISWLALSATCGDRIPPFGTRTREFFDLSQIKSDYASSSSCLSLSLSLSFSGVLHRGNRCPLWREVSFSAHLVGNGINSPRAFSAPGVSLVAKQLYLFIRRIGHASRASLKIAPRAKGRFATALAIRRDRASRVKLRLCVVSCSKIRLIYVGEGETRESLCRLSRRDRKGFQFPYNEIKRRAVHNVAS